jgi:hypothetical protein
LSYKTGAALTFHIRKKHNSVTPKGTKGLPNKVLKKLGIPNKFEESSDEC